MQFMIGSLFGKKLDLLEQLLEKGKVMVHLDARKPGVDVPAQHRKEHHLRLKLSLHFGIDDFDYDQEGVRASLLFRGARYYCVLPWSSIFAITSHVDPLGYLWPEDLPAELATQLSAMPTPPQPRVAQPSLRVVNGGGETESDGADAADSVSEEPDGRRYGHLRVVK